MFNEEGKLTSKALKAARVRPAFQSQVIYGIGTVDAESVQSWFYGFAKGLQYTGIDTGVTDITAFAQSNCFYSVYGLVDTMDLAIYDTQNIIGNGSFNWFNVAMYDPTHFLGNLTVTYQ